MTYGELVHTETDPKGIEYRVYVQQDDDPRGNVLASGSDDEDRAAEDEVIARMDAGDSWAWALVTVEARYKGFRGFDFLGGCCYRDTADFVQPEGYYGDMKREALNALRLTVHDAAAVSAELEEVL